MCIKKIKWLPDTVYDCYYSDHDCNIQSVEGSLHWVDVLTAYHKVAIESIPEVSGANPPTFEMPDDKRHEWAVTTSKSYPLWIFFFFVCWPFSLAINFITAKEFVPWLAYVDYIWLPSPSGSFLMSHPTRICYEKFLLTVETCFLTKK